MITDGPGIEIKREIQRDGSIQVRASVKLRGSFLVPREDVSEESLRRAEEYAFEMIANAAARVARGEHP